MLPSTGEIEVPLLLELYVRGGAARPSDRDSSGHDVYESLARYFKLSHADLQERVYETDGTPRSKWENNVRSARESLRKKRLITNTARGIWALSSEARRTIEDKLSQHKTNI